MDFYLYKAEFWGNPGYCYIIIEMLVDKSERDAQGDVTSLIDITNGYMGDGIQYTYSAYGRIYTENTGADLGMMISDVNTLTFKSYSYDSDLGMYYLGSRWYDPEVCRFINADSYVKTPTDSLLSTNMFAYCENNPVMRSDSTGQWFGFDDLIAGAVGAVVGVGSQFISDAVTSAVSGSWEFSGWQAYAGAAVGGAIGGVTTLYAGPVIGAAVGAGSSTLIGQTLENVTGGQKRSAAKIVTNTLVDATIGATVSKFVPINVPGITSGRNSLEAVYKSGLTKLGNMNASKMSIKVVGKGIVSNFVADLGLASGMGVKSFISDSWQLNQKQQPTIPTGLYWCAP